MKLLLIFLISLVNNYLLAGIKNSSKIFDKTALTLSLSVVNSTCQKANGKIIVQASGGFAPYNYILDAPGFLMNNTTGLFYSVPAGTYTLTVTDALNQTATQPITVNNTYQRPSVSLVSRTSPSDCMATDASITIAASGGLAPYTYSIDGRNYQVSNTISNLTAGTYYYTVKDANGCISFHDYLYDVVVIPTNCPTLFNRNGGSASVGCIPYFYYSLNVSIPTGGTPPYSYSRDGINFQSSHIFDDLYEPVNTFWIKDAVGNVILYSSSFIDICDPPFVVSTETQPAKCNVNGSITVTATEGIPPYRYSLDGINFQPSNQFTGLTAGGYVVTVKDFYDFASARHVTVPDNCVVVTPTTTNSTCGNSDGKITAQGSNGTAPYLYSLDGVTYTANNIFTNLAAANYTLYVKDAVGAIGKANVIITNIGGPQITSVTTNPTACDNHSGSITITATGGTAPLNYSIDGSTFQTNATFTGIAQGNYTVKVKDGNACVATEAAIVALSGTVPIVNLGSDVTLCEDKTLILDATNANATYLWQDNSTAATYLVTKAGKYYVTVDKQGCTAKDTITVNYNLKPKFSLGADTRICMGSTIILDPQLQGVSYLWQDGSTASTYTVTQPGVYSLTATNSCGLATASVNIGNGVCNLYIPNSFTPNGDGKNDLFKAGYGDNVTDFHLWVYNRYGQIVFEAKDKSKGWDGLFAGSKQPEGAYAWVIQYKTVTDNSMQKMQGTVMLIR